MKQAPKTLMQPCSTPDLEEALEVLASWVVPNASFRICVGQTGTRTGNPNGSGNSPWPQFTNQSGAAAVLSENVPSLSTFTEAQYAASHHCAFWDPLLGY